MRRETRWAWADLPWEASAGLTIFVLFVAAMVAWVVDAVRHPCIEQREVDCAILMYMGDTPTWIPSTCIECLRREP